MSNENIGDGPDKDLYERNGIKLIPYVEINGQKTIPDSYLLKLYEMMSKEATLSTVFYEGFIETERELLNFIKNPNNLVIFFVKEESILGYAWINNITKNYAFGHFCFFKEAWGELTKTMGKMALDYWMNFPSIDLIIGLVPSFNKRAIRYIQEMGFTTLGEIPKMADVDGKKSSMTINYYTR